MLIAGLFSLAAFCCIPALAQTTDCPEAEGAAEWRDILYEAMRNMAECVRTESDPGEVLGCLEAVETLSRHIGDAEEEIANICREGS